MKCNINFVNDSKKVLGIIIACSLIIVSGNQLFGQELKKDSINEEENLIDLPWFGKTELEAINDIESQDSLIYSDYIQLSFYYAKLGRDNSKIEELVEKAFKLNSKESCDIYSTMIKSSRNYNIIKLYGNIIAKKLEEYECEFQ